MSIADIKLTPSEDLILEVLIARGRTGETIWPFASRHRKVIDSLADKGLVYSLSGNVSGTVRAMLTDAAKAEFLTPWLTPVGRDVLDYLSDAVPARIYNDVKGIFGL